MKEQVVTAEPVTTRPEGPAGYPGSDERPADVFALANEYAAAATSLLSEGRGRKRLARNPGHLCAMHAIELYLNAYLPSRSQSPELVRGMGHSLFRKSELAASLGLTLSKRTALHLAGMTHGREYLVVRYAPTAPSEKMSPSNRLVATVAELAKKVAAAVHDEKAP